MNMIFWIISMTILTIANTIAILMLNKKVFPECYKSQIDVDNED